MVANENFNLTPNDESEDFTLEFGEVVNVGGGGGTSDFNQLTNRPKYNDQAMTGSTNIPAVPTKTSDLTNDSDYQTGSEVESAISSAIADKQDALTAGDNITIEDNTISATDTTYTAGANVSISDENVISATDTTYSNFTGTDGNTGGTSGLVPAPATTDAGKFLKADGTWDTAGGGGGSVTTLTSADFNYPVNNPDGIAMWLLPDGDYVTTLTSDYIYPDNTASKIIFRYFSKITDGNSAIAYYTDTDNVWKYWNTNKNTGARISYGRMAPRVQQSSGTSQTDVMSQDATTKLVDGRVKQNAGAPTTSTVGMVGQLLEDTTNGKLYQCTAVSGSTYTWAEVGAGGGGGPTVVQTPGTSTTNVMSQKASTDIIYGEGNPAQKIAILNNTANEKVSPSSGQYNGIGSQSVLLSAGWTYTAGNRNVMIGGSGGGLLGPTSTNTNLQDLVAIGYNATNNYNGSVALGSYSKTSAVGEMNIGTSDTSCGYNSSSYRLLSGVYDGQNAHDAVTVGQVNATIDAINTALGTSIPHIGA